MPVTKNTMIEFKLLVISFLALLQGTTCEVRTNLTYIVNDGVRPYFYGYRREGIEDGVVDRNGTYVKKEVTVANGRLHDDISLDSHSFELVRCDTTLTTAEFYEEDQRKIKDIYYKEMEECVKSKLGAERVVTFHHQIRNQERNNSKGPNDIVTSIQGYAHGVHSDVHPESADATYAWVSADNHVGLRYLSGRYLYMNLWRNIDDIHPIVDDHLAVLDQRSLTTGVGSEDYIESDYYGKTPQGFDYSIKQYLLNEKNSDAHRWFYFPNMTKSEAIFFKQWDSDPNRANVGFHTAIKDPTVRSPSPGGPRQSIEIRMIAYFPDHEPNTCPSKWKSIWIQVLLASIGFVYGYPMAAKGVSIGFIAAMVYLLRLCCCRRRPSSKSVKND